MKKAIVTGATGFIGKSICKKLLAEGYFVYGIGRNRSSFKELEDCPHFKSVYLDFDKYDIIDNAIEDRSFDFLIHAATSGVNGRDKKNYKIQFENVIGTIKAVESAARLKVRRFVYLGSVDEFESSTVPDSDFIQPNSTRIYGLSKHFAESIGKVVSIEKGMEFVGALLSLTYGEGNYTNILPNTIIKKTYNGEPIDLIRGDVFFDMVYIDDAVDGILSIAKKGKNLESYFVGHEDLKTFKEYVEDICSCFEVKAKLMFGKYPDAKSFVRFDRIRRDKLRIDTGFSCHADLKQSIINTKNWLLSKKR